MIYYSCSNYIPCSEEAISGSNQIKAQHETIKFLNQKVMLQQKQLLRPWKWIEFTSAWGTFNTIKSCLLFSMLLMTKFHILHNNVTFLARICAERGTRNRQQAIFRKAWTRYAKNFYQKRNLWWLWRNWDYAYFLQIFFTIFE